MRFCFSFWLLVEVSAHFFYLKQLVRSMMEDSTVLEVIGQLNSASPKSDSIASSTPEQRYSSSKREVGSLGQSKSLATSESCSDEAETAEQREKHLLQPEQFVAVVAGLQFAVVILIAQRRIPLANDAEFFVVLSMLMITAAHGKIIDFLPDGTSIHSDCAVISFIGLVIPVFAFMIIIELWFTALLFSYDPAVDLVDLQANADKILNIGKFFGIAKILLVISVIVLPRIAKRFRKVGKNH